MDGGLRPPGREWADQMTADTANLIALPEHVGQTDHLDSPTRWDINFQPDRTTTGGGGRYFYHHTFTRSSLKGLRGASVLCFFFFYFMLAPAALRPQRGAEIRNSRMCVKKHILWTVTEKCDASPSQRNPLNTFIKRSTAKATERGGREESHSYAEPL